MLDVFDINFNMDLLNKYPLFIVLLINLIANERKYFWNIIIFTYIFPYLVNILWNGFYYFYGCGWNEYKLKIVWLVVNRWSDFLVLVFFLNVWMGITFCRMFSTSVFFYYSLPPFELLTSTHKNNSAKKKNNANPNSAKSKIAVEIVFFFR